MSYVRREAYNGASGNVYIDGNPHRSTSAMAEAGNFAPTTVPFSINGGDNTSSFSGPIEEVRT